jgi:TPP-dependent 2-oxoacid decarboxylase
MSSPTYTIVGEYLINKLYSLNVRHVFGIPGDYVLGFYDQLSRSKIKIVNTCDEQSAGFAADAYARIRGLGAACITYCVGGLKVVNSIAQAYAEKSPVIGISGSPGLSERKRNTLLHHKVRK